MIQLALDTSSLPASLALARDGEVLVQTLEPQQASAENLLLEIKNFLAQENLTFDDLDEVLTTTGPAPFIGLRIGLAAALGISFACDIPLFSMKTFVVYASFATKQNKTILTHRPARQGVIAFQTFSPELEPLMPLSCLDEDAFCDFAQDEKFYRVPEAFPVPIAQQLLVAAKDFPALLEEGATPCYPPQAPYRSLMSGAA